MRISVCIPVYGMKNGLEFLKRSFTALEEQTFRDFEIVITDDSMDDKIRDFCKEWNLPIRYVKNMHAKGMAGNTNTAIQYAEGEIIKILFQDDCLFSKYSLEAINDNFKGGWLVTGCMNTLGQEHFASYNDQIYTGLNTIGSPSVLAFENKEPLLFDERLSWVLDCDYYKRLHEKYGEPTILNEINVIIGVGDHQTTHLLPDETKEAEVKYLINKYA